MPDKRRKIPGFHQWENIHRRCRNPKDRHFPRYGGRGIYVCWEWWDFKTFLRDLQAMGPRPPGASIDRIDNDGPYAPWNVRWATPKQQSNNRSPGPRADMKLVVTHMGKPMNSVEAARQLGIATDTLNKRLRRMRERDPKIPKTIEIGVFKNSKN